MKIYDIVFAVIAMREVVFFANVADILKQKGLKIGFITFYEPGDSYLEAKGYDVYSLHKAIKNKKYQSSLAMIDEVEKKYQIENLKDIIRHEKLTFNRNEGQLLEKTITYFAYFEDLFNQIYTRAVFQELGGFIAHLTLYNTSLHKKINHVFFEPSVFKGRLHMLLNTINAGIEKKRNCYPDTILAQVNEYMGRYNNDKPLVIPKKDIHHFKDATLSKLINKENINKLYNKINNKYIKKLSEEFDAIENHVHRYIKMYINRKQIDTLYSQPDYKKTYVYFPFHVPLDFQLTVRSPEYLDQLSLISYIADTLPYGYYLYIKEHPASIGAYSRKELRNLLKNENIRLIKPMVNSYDLIRYSQGVVTINSKVGAEALMQAKPVTVLGSAFYRNQEITNDIKDIREIRTMAKKLMASNLETEDIKMFFCQVLTQSYLGELYDNSTSNVNFFAQSISIFCAENGLSCTQTD